MVRPIIVGNGDMLVCMDKHAQIRDFYYPYIGQENHVSSHKHRIGVWVDGGFSWVNGVDWDLRLAYKEDCLVSDVTATHHGLGIQLHLYETVPTEKNVFLRKVYVRNLLDKKRKIKLFFSQHFSISETNIGNTVYFDPRSNSIVNYRGRRYFLVGGRSGEKDFDEYATGAAGVEGKEGSFRDAEDGYLSKNSIQHGSVDSALGFSLAIEGRSEETVSYWICVGKDYNEVCALRGDILTTGIDALIEQTEKHWREWVNRDLLNFEDLSTGVATLFKKSLLFIRAQTDNRGAIMAANDSHIFRRINDTYSYMWPRDGALVSRSLDRVGHHELTTEFFEFCSNVLSEEGYLLHKYRPDGSTGSSWHSWLKGETLQLPIQEDETALVLDALWKHYQAYKDESKIKRMYRPFIRKMADFMVQYRDEKTGLPKETYDLWEEKLGVHTFTAATVYAGLQAATNFAKLFGTKAETAKYQNAATEVREGILEHLYDPEKKVFMKGIYYDVKGTVHQDKTIDSSTPYALFEYGVLSLEDPRLESTMNQTVTTLWNQGGVGGLYRYEHDAYYRVWEGAAPNPWFIPTLWLAEYYIAKAKHIEDLEEAKKLLEWTVQRALPSGVLPEQINPYTGEALSVAPLTWSHAGFIIAVVKYCDKMEELKKKH